jgi:transcriptional regulator with XRE-family HTH domain
MLRIAPTKKATEVDAHVGRQIRLRRLLARMSQAQLADALGLTFQQVQKYEKGVNRIGAGRLFELACILGVSVEVFYAGVAAGSAGSGDDRGNGLHAFVFSEEGIKLSRAFMRIKAPQVRRRILDLMELLGEEEQPPKAMLSA